MSLPNEGTRASPHPAGPGLDQLLSEFKAVTTMLWNTEHQFHQCTNEMENIRFETSLRLIRQSDCQSTMAIFRRRIRELEKITPFTSNVEVHTLILAGAEQLHRELARVNSVMHGLTAANKRNRKTHRAVTQEQNDLIKIAAESRVSCDLSSLLYNY
jgi:hypothetical protein